MSDPGDSSEAEPAWSSWVSFLLSSSLALEGFRAPSYSHTLETHMRMCVACGVCILFHWLEPKQCLSDFPMF